MLEAWQLVHDCQRDQRLIAEHPCRIHTTTHAASPGATVLRAEANGDLIATLTITRDGPRGLGLDAMFGHELDRVRRTGQRLSEVGLMATRGAPHALDRLLALSFECALRDHYSAVVMAVSPRHASYYERMFGFERRGHARSGRARRREGLELLFVDRDAFLKNAEPPPGVRALRANPVAESFCAGAFGFLPSQIAGTPLADYLAGLDGPNVPKRQSVR